MVERRPHGGDAPEEATDFSASLNPLGPPEAVRRILQEQLDLTEYPYGLRDSLREDLAESHELPSESILLGAGTSGLIQLLLQTLSGERLTVLTPTFTEYEDLGRANNWTVEARPCFHPDERNFEGTDWVAESDAVVLCNPNNPTGTVLDPETLQGWIDRAEDANTSVIVDEAYMPFLRSRGKHSLIETVRSSRNLNVLRSFSKFYGIPGLRVGYLVADPGTVKQLRSEQNPWPVGEPALRGARQCLRAESFDRRSREWLRDERNRVLNRLENIPALTAVETAVNFVLCHTELKNLRGQLREWSLVVRDASTFTGLGDDWFRFGLRQQSDNSRLLETLRVLHEDPSRV